MNLDDGCMNIPGSWREEKYKDDTRCAVDELLALILRTSFSSVIVIRRREISILWLVGRYLGRYSVGTWVP